MPVSLLGLPLPEMMSPVRAVHNNILNVTDLYFTTVWVHPCRQPQRSHCPLMEGPLAFPHACMNFLSTSKVADAMTLPFSASAQFFTGQHALGTGQVEPRTRACLLRPQLCSLGRLGAVQSALQCTQQSASCFHVLTGSACGCRGVHPQTAPLILAPRLSAAGGVPRSLQRDHPESFRRPRLPICMSSACQRARSITPAIVCKLQVAKLDGHASSLSACKAIQALGKPSHHVHCWASRAQRIASPLFGPYFPTPTQPSAVILLCGRI
jgi:hypothetical protein